jgi:hypothetical protein
MLKGILSAALLTAAVTAWPGVSMAQESCADFMEVVRERLDQVAEDQKVKAMEHFQAAEAAQAENNEQRCIEELQLANQEIDAL